MKRLFRVEPIEISRPRSWGDVDPATKELTGRYNGKTSGACKLSESTVTEENGFRNIELLPEGQSPSKSIQRREELMKQLNASGNQDTV